MSPACGWVTPRLRAMTRSTRGSPRFCRTVAIRSGPITEADVLSAIRGAAAGPVAEGAVGAGRGTVAFGWKGGIGTSSRKLPDKWGGWTVGVLVQTNFGGDLRIQGVPLEIKVGAQHAAPLPQNGDGSIIMVVATDAPLDHLRLTRLANRALTGLARTGSSMSNGSGDYVIAFSTARPRPPSPALDRLVDTIAVVRNDVMSGLFQATIDATEEAIYNSLLRAETVRGYRGTVQALPVDSTITILKRHGAIPR